jgi:UDP-N-acetylmuramyl pentapeptide phosphotransferase/UDP-N-acetylglucosamine-1-phosphate transferase
LNTILIIKGFSILLSTILAVVALIRLAKKKTHFQIFPDSIKKEYFKEVRTMTILNILAVLLIFVAFAVIQKSYFFIIIIASMFLSINSLIQLYEDFGDFKDEDKK